MHGSNPPISVVRKFVHLLDIGDNDYSEEIGACTFISAYIYSGVPGYPNRSIWFCEN